jgi:Holliday junction DNA helicase RuvB
VQVKADGTITRSATQEALQMLEVDPLGLDKMDRMLLLALIDKFSGGPVGVETLAAAIGEEKDTIEDVYEPFLIQAGFLKRTPRGRVATPLAFEHFERSQATAKGSVAKNQPSLF